MQIVYYNYNMPEPNLWDLFLLNTPQKNAYFVLQGNTRKTKYEYV